MVNPLSWVWQREPVAIAAALRVCLYAGAYFGLKWDAEKIAAVVAAVETVLMLVTRGTVSSPTTVAAIRAGDDPAKRPPKDPPSEDLTGKRISIKPRIDSKTPPPTAAMAGALCCLLLISGCAGSLEAARKQGVESRQAGAAAAASPERCEKLDDQHRLYGALSKGFALASGSSGLATIPIDSRDAEIGLAVGAVTAGVGAAVFVYLEESSAESYARECSAR